MAYTCGKCGREVGYFSDRCPHCGSRFASKDAADVVMDGATKYLDWNGEEIGYIKSIVLGLVEMAFVYIVLGFFGVEDQIAGGIAVGWGLLFMFIAGPFKHWKWKAIIITFPSAIVTAVVLYLIDINLVKMPSWVIVVPLVVWLVCKMLFVRKYY